MLSTLTLIKKYSENEFLKALPSATIVLLDFFDTLIARSVHPEYVKELWARRLQEELGLRVSVDELHQLRVDLETQIGQEHQKQGFDDEGRYDQFAHRYYSELMRRISAHSVKNALLDTTTSFLRLAESIELAIERSVQIIQPQAYQLLEQTVSKRRMLVSDTFLTESMFRELLAHHALTDTFEKIFLSSQNLLTKRTGRLYQHILKTLPATPHELIMIGDNPISDGESAARNGITTFLVSNADHQHAYALQRKKAHSVKSHTVQLREKLAALPLFPEMALSLYFFTRELYRKARSTGAQDLFFFAREGYLLQKLFEIYQQELNPVLPPIRTHYLLVSRRSTFMPSLQSLDKEQFETLFRQYRTLSVTDFLRNLGFADADVELLGSRYPRAEEPDFPNSATWHTLRADPQFQEKYETRRVSQRKAFIAYLEGFGVDFQSGMHIVDIGWKGTIQDNLRAILPATTPLFGYYVGLLQRTPPTAFNQKYGILFSRIPHFSPFFKVFIETLSLFEILCAAPHGGVSHYDYHAGNAGACFDEWRGEKDLYENELKAYTASLLDVFRDICRLHTHSHLEPLRFFSDIARQHARMVFHPSPPELAFMTHVAHYENFGPFGHTTFSDKPSRRDTIRNFWRFLSNPRAVLHSTPWPAFSLEKVGLGILRVPYAYGKQSKIFGERIWGKNRSADGG